MTAPTDRPAIDRVFDALPEFDADGSSAEWATAKAVAEATGIGYSTVTENLRKLADAGRVESTKNGRSTVWRQTQLDAETDYFDQGDPGDTPVPASVDLVPATAEFATGDDESAVTDPADAPLDFVAPELIAPADTPVAAAAGRYDYPDAEVVDALAVGCFPPAVDGVDDYDDDTPATPAQSDVDASSGDAGTPGTPVEAPTSGAGVGAVLGFMQAVRPVSAPPAPSASAKTGVCSRCDGPIYKDGRSWKHDGTTENATALDADHKATTRRAAPSRTASEPKRSTCTRPDCGQPIVKDGRSWKHEVSLPAESDHKATTAVQRVPSERAPRGDGEQAARVAPVRDGLARAWERGELKTTITRVLQLDPTMEWSASNLTKSLNDSRADGAPIAQSGSVDFTLKTLHKEGVLKLTQETPRRYAAA